MEADKKLVEELKRARDFLHWLWLNGDLPETNLNSLTEEEKSWLCTAAMDATRYLDKEISLIEVKEKKGDD